MTENILLTLSFVGSRYHGTQIQSNACTVQSELQRALKELFGALPEIKCCSRLDSGVHAREFTVSFKRDGAPDDASVVSALNTLLPPDIRVLASRRVPLDFHARYSARGKSYRYLVYNSRVMDPFLYGRALMFVPPIDERSLGATAKAFVGTHDFKAFCSSKTDAADTVRTVSDFTVTREGSTVSFDVTADGFLYNMVRVMVGTLLNSARGKVTREDIASALESGVRTNLFATAPAQGLYLQRVIY